MKYTYKTDVALVLKGMMNTRNIHRINLGLHSIIKLDSELFIKQLQNKIKYTLRYL